MIARRLIRIESVQAFSPLASPGSVPGSPFSRWCPEGIQIRHQNQPQLTPFDAEARELDLPRMMELLNPNHPMEEVHFCCSYPQSWSTSYNHKWDWTRALSLLRLWSIHLLLQPFHDSWTTLRYLNSAWGMTHPRPNRAFIWVTFWIVLLSFFLLWSFFKNKYLLNEIILKSTEIALQPMASITNMKWRNNNNNTDSWVGLILV